MKLHHERRVMVGMFCLVALTASPAVVPEWTTRLGSSTAMMGMSGYLFFYGRDAQDEKEVKTAVALCRCVVVRGYPRAQFIVVAQYREELLLPKGWYCRTAEQGQANAQYNLACCDEAGRGRGTGYRSNPGLV